MPSNVPLKNCTNEYINTYATESTVLCSWQERDGTLKLDNLKQGTIYKNVGRVQGNHKN